LSAKAADQSSSAAKNLLTDDPTQMERRITQSSQPLNDKVGHLIVCTWKKLQQAECPLTKEIFCNPQYYWIDMTSMSLKFVTNSILHEFTFS